MGCLNARAGLLDHALRVVDVACIDVELRCTNLSGCVVQRLAIQCVGRDAEQARGAQTCTLGQHVAAVGCQAQVTCSTPCGAGAQIQIAGIEKDIPCGQYLTCGLQRALDCGREHACAYKFAVNVHARSKHVGAATGEAGGRHTQVLAGSDSAAAGDGVADCEGLVASGIQRTAVAEAARASVKAIGCVDTSAVGELAAGDVQATGADNACAICHCCLCAALGVVQQQALAAHVEGSAARMQQLTGGVVDALGGDGQVVGAGLDDARGIVEATLEDDRLIGGSCLHDLTGYVAQTVRSNAQRPGLDFCAICDEGLGGF